MSLRYPQQSPDVDTVMATYLLNVDRQRTVLGTGPFNSCEYSPYGITSPGPMPGLAFCGQHRDPLTGSYPLGNGHRFYSPSLMRFTTPDALSPFSRGGVNAYAYCGADPVNRHDPSGKWWSAILRAIGLVSSGATLFGSLARTAKNVVGRRAAFRNAGGSNLNTHQELPHLSRVSNQNFFITGTAGVAGQIAGAISGVRPTLQTATDALNVVNAVTNLSGGSIGNYAAGREVVTYLRANPSEIPGVFVEMIVDVTMLDEMLSALGRWITALGSKIRTYSSRPYDTQT